LQDEAQGLRAESCSSQLISSISVNEEDNNCPAPRVGEFVTNMKRKDIGNGFLGLAAA
jgi:hypothetical protein